MSVKVIIGAQWGDEGKGKLVDFLAADADVVARYQGGANAGHTVYVGEKKYILHLIPGGILRENVVCIIGNGVVFDPEAFFSELNLIKDEGISIQDRLFISDRAHLILPYHKLIDQLSEKSKDAQKIGTTGKGIGPAYVDKYQRIGIRMCDLLNEISFKAKLRENLTEKNQIIVEKYNETPLDYDEVLSTYLAYAKQLQPFIKDCQLLLHDAWRKNENILLEGAQGCLLDTDFGSYPFVTSSNPTAGGAVTGTGLPPTAMEEIVGVIKAYTTRVGSGPFPSEKTDETGEKLRAVGHEFGATTGRPRRCGWLDLVAARYSMRINGFTQLALTKLDVLENFESIEVCVSYIYNGKKITEFPADLNTLENSEAVTEALPGWNEPIGDCRKFEDLPINAQKYVKYLEEVLKTPIKYVSVGVERNQIIVR
jgi:adenylosuccinate synthase